MTVGKGDRARDIAYLIDPAHDDAQDTTGLIWLLGLKSDMTSTKASALSAWAPQKGYNLTRFEYSGHGASAGVFENATIGDWLEETHAVFSQLTSGRQILVGSSTGGHIALLMLRDLLRNNPKSAKRIKGLVLIAPAWDLTEELMWKAFPEEARRDIMDKGVYMMPSDYGEPYPITRNFIEEGRNHLIGAEPFDPGCPVIILQGRLDTSVPPQHARALRELLKNNRANLIDIPDGNHSLSRPQDIEKLFNAIDLVNAQS